MTGLEYDGYPHADVGADADPPTQPAPRVVEMGRRAAARDLAAAQPLEELYEVGPWRLAHAIDVLGTEADAANPRRDTKSDGTIGDTRHAAAGTSDHLPLVRVAGKGIVRARDIDVDGLDLPTAFERARRLAAAGKLPQLTGGGYLILNGRITTPDFTGWRLYTGENPHVTHGHVSVSRDPARFDSRAAWGIFAATPPPAPKPKPAPAPAAHDLTGRAQSLRGAAGDTGPRVRELQGFLNRYAPAYSHLTVDGQWGEKTTAVLAVFARRSSIPADGRNIGPRIAAALWRAGFDRTGAPARALRHLARDGRR